MVSDLALVVLLLAPPWAWEAPDGRAGWIQAIVYAALVLPVLWRRRYPAAAAAVVVAAGWITYLGQVWGQALPWGALSLEVMLYTLAVLGRRRHALVVAAIGVVLYLTIAMTWVYGPTAGWFAIGNVMMLATAWALGEFIGARRAYVAEVERRATLADSERRALARAAVAEERNRIARELHDVLAHTVSVIVVNAEGAKLFRHNDPQAVDRTLDTISTTGRSALRELRRLLLQVRQSDEPLREPQPTVGELRSLVSLSSDGRAPIELTVRGSAEDVPASAALQTYRIVQEGLTNVIKHASPDADARVTVDFGVAGASRRIQIAVTNSAGTRARPPAAPLPSAGRGLPGMRERVALFQGTLDAGPTGDGGYRLTAELPFQALDGMTFDGPALDDRTLDNRTLDGPALDDRTLDGPALDGAAR